MGHGVVKDKLRVLKIPRGESRERHASLKPLVWPREVLKLYSGTRVSASTGPVVHKVVAKPAVSTGHVQEGFIFRRGSLTQALPNLQSLSYFRAYILAFQGR